MKRKITLVLLLCIPVLMFANAFQAFRYVQQENTIHSLDREQRSLVEANKRNIYEISVLTSPSRIRELADSSSRFERGYPDEIVYVYKREAERD